MQQRRMRVWYLPPACRSLIPTQKAVHERLTLHLANLANLANPASERLANNKKLWGGAGGLVFASCLQEANTYKHIRPDTAHWKQATALLLAATADILNLWRFWLFI